jgi:protein TonB
VYPSTLASPRQLAVAGAVIALHGMAFWLLQNGTMYRIVTRLLPVAIPVQLLSDAVVAPSPLPQAALKSPSRAQPPSTPAAAAAAQAPAVEVAAPAPAPAPATTTASAVSAPAVPEAAASATAAVSVAAPAASAPPPARIELPSSDADYLQNPRPPYPPVSKRLNEQGTVIVRVLIGADGRPQQAELRKSSGHERLDRVALTTVMSWRYVPGKRAGVPETMWFDVPISFVLE